MKYLEVNSRENASIQLAKGVPRLKLFCWYLPFLLLKLMFVRLIKSFQLQHDHTYIWKKIHPSGYIKTSQRWKCTSIFTVPIVHVFLNLWLYFSIIFFVLCSIKGIKTNSIHIRLHTNLVNTDSSFSPHKFSVSVSLSVWEVTDC